LSISLLALEGLVIRMELLVVAQTKEKFNFMVLAGQ